MATVAVIGGGVVGLFSAMTLAQRGHQVTVLDEGRLDQGCSHGNSGLLVPSHFVPLACPGVIAKGLRWLADPSSPFRIKPSLDPRLARWAWLFQRSCSAAHVERCGPLLRDLAWESLARYRELAASSLAGAMFRESGLFMACTTPHGLEEEERTAASAIDLGLRAEVLDAAGAKTALGGFDGAGAVHYPDDAQVDPSRLMEALVGALESHGVVLERGQRVGGVALVQGSAVARRTDGSRIETDWLVVAAGSRTAEILRPLGHDLPLVGGKGYSFVVDQPSPCLGAPVILAEDKVAISPLGARVRLGGTLEIGTKPDETDMRRVHGISSAARKAFPQFGKIEPVSSSVWSGQRPCTPDGLPYVGALKGVSNLTVATGHAMLGMTLAPATARIVADCVEGQAAPPELDPMRFC